MRCCVDDLYTAGELHSPGCKFNTLPPNTNEDNNAPLMALLVPIMVVIIVAAIIILNSH